MEKGRIILASASPRRLELLASAGVEFDVCASDIPEEPIPGEAPADFATRLARDKAVATAARTEGRWFVGADTIVVCDGEIMGKPVDEADAVRMLRKLSGVSHEVITGYAVYDRERDGLLCKAVVTRVVFKPLRDEEISAYVATGCPMDKAGAYAIQGGAAYMVERIDGSYTNVVGLPLCEVVEDLRRIGAL
ncbi:MULTISPECIES: Maf family nucleotide pyrophosphatase [Geobacter]|uniref:Maf family nucleotide pyrophosphatase n=1 Tax=Geobacter TaxID=28231 RepID=UPI002572318A|nr:Maf family nucleotide pyrophosphatase [Geobacter sulfurreducens]BEH09512.1 Maf family nucleotide pyrophosphatase [Geobacter sulfurreducens subsp. ethanolicus]BET57394.1 Maf family nucleotide pyrophosphatase [Geobacter sp. 60473]